MYITVELLAVPDNFRKVLRKIISSLHTCHISKERKSFAQAKETARDANRMIYSLTEAKLSD